jgi:hypothetical protein
MCRLLYTSLSKAQYQYYQQPGLLREPDGWDQLTLPARVEVINFDCDCSPKDYL